MILHSYIFDRMELEVVEEIEPNFIVAKYGNAFGLYMQMDEHQSKYFRNAGVRQYEAIFDSEGKSIPSDEFCPFVPEILFDDKGIGYLRLVAPHWVYTLEDLRIKANALIAVDKEICDHDNFYSGSLRDALIGYEMVQRV